MTGRRPPWRRRPSVTGPVAPADARHEIVRLAVPAFLALVAEPLFLLADAAIVGHLGTPQLAGLGIASSVLGTLVSLCIFLAYGTTASRRPTGWCRRHRRRAGPGRGRPLAGGADRGGRDGRGAAGDTHGRRLVRPERRRRGVRHDVPARRPARRRAPAADARRHRRPPRPPGHAHAAGGRRGRQRRERGAQPRAGVRPGAGHRRLRTRHPGRPARVGAGAGLGGGPGGAGERRPAGARPARDPRRRPGPAYPCCCARSPSACRCS